MPCSPIFLSFEWCECDVGDAVQVREVYELLHLNYVEDDDAMFRCETVGLGVGGRGFAGRRTWAGAAQDSRSAAGHSHGGMLVFESVDLRHGRRSAGGQHTSACGGQLAAALPPVPR
jgi:hypothetical protein